MRRNKEFETRFRRKWALDGMENKKYPFLVEATCRATEKRYKEAITQKAVHLKAMKQAESEKQA